MKLGLLGGYGGRKVGVPIDQIRHAEALGEVRHGALRMEFGCAGRFKPVSVSY